MKFLYKIVSYKTSICQLLRVTDSNTDYRAFIKRAIRAQTRGERARGSSPDSRPTPHAARGRVSTLLACWRLFSLRDCGEAARESLGGNLRVEGREETVSIVYSHPHLTEERRHAWRGPASFGKGEGPLQKMEQEWDGPGHREQSQPGSVCSWRNQGVGALPSPTFCPACAHLFPGDLTQAGVCVPSRDVIPSAVSPAHKGAGWGSSSSHSPQH